MSLVSLVEIGRLSGLGTPALVQLVKHDFIRPAQERPMRFHLPTIIGCALSEWMRKKGYARRAIHSVLIALSNYTEAGLLRYFDAGKTHLLIVNNLAGPILVAADAAEADPEIAPMLAAAKESGLKVEVFLLDIKAAYLTAKRKLTKDRSTHPRNPIAQGK